MTLSKSTFELEKKLKENGYLIIIGTDEVGRGPLAGPVVAAAAMYKNTDFEIPVELVREFDFIRDSKKISEKKREEMFDFIFEHFHIGIGLCDQNTIDRINILEASFLSMKKAVQELQRKLEKENPKSYNLKPKTCILVDGNKTIPNFSIEQKAVIGGDRISKSISAASIVAKVTRDRMMLDYSEKYPQYYFEKHKGYGTKIHMEALEKHGYCEIHRKSFAPVARLAKLNK